MNYLFTDGGARGNPGPGAVGVVIKDENRKIIFEIGSFLGVCTNNEAEYQALILGLQTAAEKRMGNLEVCMDSELVVKQMNKEYKVKNGRLKELHDIAKGLSEKFSSITFRHIPRAQNSQADALVNKVLDAMKVNG